MNDWPMAVVCIVIALGISLGFPLAGIISEKTESNERIEMAKAGMEQVVQSVTNETGKVTHIVVWKKTNQEKVDQE